MNNTESLYRAKYARTKLALQQLVKSSDYGICTFATIISKFSAVESFADSSVKYSRQRFNRMDCAQQLEYQRKLDKKVIKYMLYDPETKSGVSISKLIFDHCLSLGYIDYTRI